MKIITKIVFVFLISLVVFQGCVDSIIDNKAGTPSIILYSPSSNGRAVIGNNTITYEAADHANGQGLSHYEVYLNDQLNNTISQNSDGENPNLILIIPKSLLDERISYYVNVYNKDGQVKQSDKMTNVLVVDAIPTSPGNLSLTRLTEHSVNLLWDDSSDNETSFELWRKVSSTGEYGENPYRIMPRNTISTDDVGLSPTIEYFYKVRAVNETGSSGFSNEVSTSSTSGSLWDLKAYAIGSSAIHLTWIDFFPSELGFILERKNPLTNTWERVDPLPLRNTTEYFDYNVTANTTYQYRITYYTNTTVGPWSNIVIITTYYTDDKPPKNLIASKFSTNAVSAFVKITWTLESNLEDGTIIERKRGVEGKYIQVGEVGQGIKEFYDSIIFSTSGTGTFYYRARHILTEKVFTYYSNEDDVIIP